MVYPIKTRKLSGQEGDKETAVVLSPAASLLGLKTFVKCDGFYSHS